LLCPDSSGFEAVKSRTTDFKNKTKQHKQGSNMKKIALASTSLLALCAVTATVNAQATTAPQSSNLVGEILGAAAVIAIFCVIGYAGYKIIKKWSSSTQN
jgi:protein-S-isoprenylcysteine O-methyltransferase Ste14